MTAMAELRPNAIGQVIGHKAGIKDLEALLPFSGKSCPAGISSKADSQKVECKNP